MADMDERFQQILSWQQMDQNKAISQILQVVSTCPGYGGGGHREGAGSGERGGSTPRGGAVLESIRTKMHREFRNAQTVRMRGRDRALWVVVSAH